MINFIDTNVIVGYCFQADTWHDHCQILDRLNNIWSSSKVLDEWQDIEDYILDNHISLINKHIDQIKRTFPDMIEMTHRDRLLRSVPHKVQSFLGKIYLEQIDYPLTKDELCDHVERKMLDMQHDKTMRFLKIDSTCKKHTRTKDYGFENDKLKPCVHNGNRDRGIVLDAHDLILNMPSQKIRFLTLDNAISDECKDKIITYLKIAEVKDLKYCPPSMYSR